MNAMRQVQGLRSGIGGFLWGAAHALDLGGVLLDDGDWGGPEADARAIAGDWRVALDMVDREIDEEADGR